MALILSFNLNNVCDFITLMKLFERVTEKSTLEELMMPSPIEQTEQ